MAPRPWAGRPAFLAGAVLLALVVACSADGHLEGEDEMMHEEVHMDDLGRPTNRNHQGELYGPAMGCGWPKDPSPCPVWTDDGYMHPDNMAQKYDISQQDVPCMSRPATCEFQGTYNCHPDMIMPAADMEMEKFYQIKPGSPAVCGHGNREFSYLVKKRSMEKVLVVFGAGGICWDAATCGDPMMRTMAADSMGDSGELAPSVPKMFARNALPAAGALTTSGIFDVNPENPFYDWSIIIIPDCTGDMNLGNRSYTYNEGMPSCITAHHKGAVNAGLAIDWMMHNFPSMTHILMVGTGGTQNTPSKAYGAHGLGFWKGFLMERLPLVNIRLVVDSSMAVFGPDFYQAMERDPWGTLESKVPMPNEEWFYLVPDLEEYFIGHDDQTYFYELGASYFATAAFMEISTTEDPVQKMTFEATGGMMADCCLDGCNNDDEGPCKDVPLSRDMLGGLLDWTKSRRVAMVRRSLRLPKHYWSWLTTGERHFLLTNGDSYNSCPDGDTCDSTKVLKHAVFSFATSVTTLDQEGTVMPGFMSVARTSATNDPLPPTYFTCDGCLDGIILGNGDEYCNATMGRGENLFTVAKKYGTDWMALWSLNGDDTPEVRSRSTSYRFAHQYHVRAGESMEMIAQRFGVAVEDVVHLNFNQFTHIQNPFRVKEGDPICIAPVFHRTMDQMGNPICPSDAQRFGENIADMTQPEQGVDMGSMDGSGGTMDMGMESSP